MCLKEKPTTRIEPEYIEKARCGDKDNQLFCSEPVEWHDSKVFIEQYEKEHFR